MELYTCYVNDSNKATILNSHIGLATNIVVKKQKY